MSNVVFRAPSLICPPSFLLLIFLLFTARHKVSQPQRWGGNERSDRSLSGHFHKAESWSIRSTFQNWLGLRPTWLVFSKAPGSGFNWEAAHVQLGISCLFFWNRLSSFLSFRGISVIPLLSNPPPHPHHFHPRPRYLAVITDYVMLCADLILSYCTPYHCCKKHSCSQIRYMSQMKSRDRFACLEIMVSSASVTVMV